MTLQEKRAERRFLKSAIPAVVRRILHLWPEPFPDSIVLLDSWHYTRLPSLLSNIDLAPLYKHTDAELRGTMGEKTLNGYDRTSLLIAICECYMDFTAKGEQKPFVICDNASFINEGADYRLLDKVREQLEDFISAWQRSADAIRQKHFQANAKLAAHYRSINYQWPLSKCALPYDEVGRGENFYQSRSSRDRFSAASLRAYKALFCLAEFSKVEHNFSLFIGKLHELTRTKSLYQDRKDFKTNEELVGYFMRMHSVGWSKNNPLDAHLTALHGGAHLGYLDQFCLHALIILAIYERIVLQTLGTRRYSNAVNTEGR